MILSTRNGFTLIELMIAVAVVAIMAAIAYPTYQEQLRRGYRSEAKALLMENAQFMERNFTANNCYHRTDSACSTATVTTALPKTQAPESGTARYNISFVTGEPTSTTYSIRAVPAGTMSGDQCGTFTLNQLGQQNITDKPTGSTKTTAECWAK